VKTRHHLVNLLKNLFSLKFSGKRSVIDRKRVHQEWYAPAKPTDRTTEPTVTWIGQATFLVQIDGINILTDPIFYDLSYIFPRLVPAGITPEQLPRIDVVLISHDHRDHMEKNSMRALLLHKPTILAPLGLGKRLSRWGFDKISEHNWNDKLSFATPSGKKIDFSFLPASHWAGCNLFNINKSKFGSWMIEHDLHAIYFAGDSSYGKHFCEIGQQFESIQTALMPISPIEPRHLVEHAHLDGKQAIQAFLDLNAQRFIPMHWGTFQFGTEQYDEPIILLKKFWHKHGLDGLGKQLSVLKFGAAQRV